MQLRRPNRHAGLMLYEPQSHLGDLSARPTFGSAFERRWMEHRELCREVANGPAGGTNELREPLRDGRVGENLWLDFQSARDCLPNVVLGSARQLFDDSLRAD